MSDGAEQQARGAATVFEVLRDFQADGFDGDLYAEEGAQVRCGTCDEVSPAASLEVAQLRRLEGASDPAEMSAVVAAPCPRCGARGVMVVMYGPEAGAVDADLLAALPTPSTPEERPGAHSG